METINISLSTDNNYAPYTGVTLCSIFENRTSPNPINICILDGGILPTNKEKLEALAKKYSFEINFIKINPSLFKDFKIINNMAKPIYYRMILPNLLPNLNKILYLDSDTIVLGDIWELYNININNYLCAAVDEEVYSIEKLISLGIKKDGMYFNSGVLLMNLNKWRKESISEKVIDFIKNNKEKYETNFFKTHDQDALNAILSNNWLNLPFRFNYRELLFSDKHPIASTELKKYILILHYIGIKPWNYFCRQKFRKEYYYYLKKTSWKNEKFINKTFKNIIIRFIWDFIDLSFPNFIIVGLKKMKNNLNIKFY